MKRVVLLNDLDIPDVISRGLYKEYITYLKEDIKAYFSKDSSVVDVVCPGCGKRDNQKVYEKMGLDFKVCSQCSSCYVSPRPKQALLERFYRESRACKYWRKGSLTLPDTQSYYIYGPRMNWILELVDEFLREPSVLLDVETKYPHLLRHLMREDDFKSILSFKPQLFEQLSLVPDRVIIEDKLDNLGLIDVITAFETLERMFDPSEFFLLANKYCKPGGLLLITTASYSGFEYQVLGENAPNINPINRMNLLSIEALSGRIQSAGFELIELSTPGRLDVEITRQAIEELGDIKMDSFWKYIFKFRDEKTWRDLQNFLQINRLSSHVRIVARKKENSA